MSFGSAVDKATDLGEPKSVHDFLKLCPPIGANDQHHLIDLVTLLEPVNRMSDHRLVANQAQQFIKSHPLTAASRDNNGGDHRRVVSGQWSVASGNAVRSVEIKRAAGLPVELQS